MNVLTSSVTFPSSTGNTISGEGDTCNKRDKNGERTITSACNLNVRRNPVIEVTCNETSLSIMVKQ